MMCHEALTRLLPTDPFYTVAVSIPDHGLELQNQVLFDQSLYEKKTPARMIPAKTILVNMVSVKTVSFSKVMFVFLI